MAAERVEIAGTPEGTILAYTHGALVPAKGATVNIYTHGTKNAVTVFTAETGGETITQPLTVSAEGTIPGWLPQGNYDIEATYEGTTLPVREFTVGVLPESIGSPQLGSEAVTMPKLALGAVGSAQILASAVTKGRLNTQQLPHGQASTLCWLGTPGAGVVLKTQTFTPANTAAFILCEATQQGKVRKVFVYNGATVSGNYRAGLLDTGQAVAGKHTLKAQSASTAMAGANAWQVIELESAVEVNAGECFMLGLLSSSTTATIGTWENLVNAGAAALPQGSVSGFANVKVKLVGLKEYAGFAFGTLTEAELLTTTIALAAFARIE